MKNIERALMIAELAHSNQTYDMYPYMYHIKSVVGIAEELGYDETILIGCALHDVLEDGHLSYNDIKTVFGFEVAEIVFAVTDELGRNRKERKEKTYPKIVKNWKAIVVKICDRIANIRHSKTTNPKMLNMYKKEHDDFYKALKTENAEVFRAWDLLDKTIKE